MATVDKTELLRRLNVELRDATNITFTVEEKEEMLRKAVSDRLVYSVVEITQTIASSQRLYPISDTYTQVLAVGYDSAADGFPVDLPGDAYDFLNNNLVINRRYMGLVAGRTLHIEVAKKWSITDNIPDYLADYIVAKAVTYSAQFLTNQRINLFLKNKTTVGELMARINEAKQTVRELKGSLRNQRLVRI